MTCSGCSALHGKLKKRKTVNCIPHDLPEAKYDAYGLNRETVACIYPYLKNR